MPSTKTAHCILSAVSVVSLLFVLSSVSSAAEKIFIKEYTYQASEIDSKVTSRAQALEQAKRLVLEELGTYLIGKTVVKDFAITSDEITVLTGGIVQTEIFDEKWNGETYYLKARIKADPDEVARSIDRLRKDEYKTKELEESKKRADDALKEIARLKAELDAVKNNDKAKQLEYTDTVKALSAADWYDKGWVYSDAKDYDNAIEAYSKAIELDPDYGSAYNNRGIAYRNKDQLDKAIEDYNKAIYLEPNNAIAYNNRAIAYNKTGQYEREMEDYNKAISLKPDLAKAYSNRGNAFTDVKQYDRAIEDFNKAISLEPDDAITYYNRANAYYKNGRPDMAIEDYGKAISLKPDFASAYYNRGYVHQKRGEDNQAHADYEKACLLGNNRGCDKMIDLEGK
ncbi:MAG: hypothetical protein A3J24_02300 [Deltaproteobacteria bacterium RIFCSPLOWO2_02_FULL_53_8]|nr:MAG: hypothetical protein A3J24_02300 [Deltaproteobacteria bacterium RIFCSPLOWO2_02_FULL_53_8]